MTVSRENSDRGAHQWEEATDFVQKVPLIAKVHQIRIVAEKHKGWRRSCYLCRVINLERSSVRDMRLVKNRILYQSVQLPSRDTEVITLKCGENCIQNRLKSRVLLG